jgi:hypothetical protein
MVETPVGVVVDLRTRSTYQPDYSALARHRLASARRSLNLDYVEFAALLSTLVGKSIQGGTVRAWETNGVPPGNVLMAATAISPAVSERIGVRSHKFIAAFVGRDAVGRLAGLAAAEEAGQTEGMACKSLPVDHAGGKCRLYVWPFGVVVYHLVEDLDLPDIASLAVWRYRSYPDNLAWATEHLRGLTGATGAKASYVLSLYWLHTAIWAGPVLDTALRIICAPRVLVDRDMADVEACEDTARQAERALLAEGFEGDGMRPLGVKGVSAGYASWSGVVYHPCDPARALAEDELVSCELATQALWAYCEHINDQIEAGTEPDVDREYGWRFLRGARSRLANPRAQETGQHRSMRDAILETSGLLGHLEQAIDVLREQER